MIADRDDAGGAWLFANATYFDADLRWDAVDVANVESLFGIPKKEVQQRCLEQFKLAYDRFSAFARKAKEGIFQFAPMAAALVVARAVDESSDRGANFQPCAFE